MEAFGQQLRRHRLMCQLSQEELAERAGVSARSVRELERGRSGPRPDTVRQLLRALRLEDRDREQFVAAGRARFRDGRPEPRQVADLDRPAPQQLPRDLPDLVGRSAETALVLRLLERSGTDPVVLVLSGPPAVGKTALGVHVAHEAAPRFPDGQIYVMCRDGTGSSSSSGHSLDAALRALGVSGAAIPAAVQDKAALYRSRIADRRVLVVLDDAACHHDVEPLLPPRGSALVVTSRLQLTGLPGATVVDLAPLPSGAAAELLGQIAGFDRVRADPAGTAEVVAACAGLPLALRVVGARLSARPGWTMASLAERLSDDSRRLDELRHGDLAVRSVLELAYRALPPGTARAFALLGSLPCATFAEWVVDAVLGVKPTPANRILDDLLEARLLSSLGPDAAGQQRYRFHDLTRLFAHDMAKRHVPPDVVQDGLLTVASQALHLARAASVGLRGDHLLLDDGDGPAAQAPAGRAVTEHPEAWFEAERETLVALVQRCARAGSRSAASAAWRLAACCADFFNLRGHVDDWQVTAEAGLAAARHADDERGIIAMLRGVGSARIEVDDWQGALVALLEARERAGRTGATAHAAVAGRDIGFLYALTGKLEEAEVSLRLAERELHHADLPSHHAVALANLGFVLRQQGKTDEAVRTLRWAASVAADHGTAYSQAYTTRALATALLAAGEVTQAQQHARQAAAAFTDLGDHIGAAQSLRVLGEGLGRAANGSEQALPVLDQALTLFRDHGFTWGVALTELTIGEILARHHEPGALHLLQRSLAYWTREQVPALRARTLHALQNVPGGSEHAGAQGTQAR